MPASFLKFFIKWQKSSLIGITTLKYCILIAGKYFYTCSGGELVPKGCVVNDTYRVQINEAYIDGGYEIQCFLNNNDSLNLKFISCVSPNGRRFKADETWEDPEV